MSVVLVLLGTGGVLLGGALAARCLRVRDPLEWLIAVGLLAAAQIVVTSVLVGAILRAYQSAALLAATVLIDAALLAAASRTTTATGPRTVLAAAKDAVRTLEWWQGAVAAIAIAALAWRAFLAVVLPPFAYDSLTYHLTMVADWVQGGRVTPNPYAGCCSHYPANAETLSGWPTVLLDHDALADAPQIALAVLGALAVAGLARHVGARPNDALTAGALFLLTPVVLTQANTAYNDVAVASLLLVALYFTTRLLRSERFVWGWVDEAPRLAHALLCGLAVGLVLGTKLSGVVIAIVVGGLLVAHVSAAVIRQSLPAASALSLVATFVGATIVVGGYWYSRNWIETGNPVWPFRIAPMGIELFSGPARVDEYLTLPPGGERFWLVELARSWYHDLVFWSRGDYSYEQRDGGLGPIWSWLGWGAIGVLMFRVARSRRDVIFNLVVPVALIVVVLPYQWWSRFTISLAALGVIALVVLLARTTRGTLRTTVISAVVVLAAVGAARSTWTLDPAGRGAKLSMVDVGGLAVNRGRERTVGALFFPEYRWLSRVPADATVLVETEAPSIRFVYPLFGASLDRRVVQLLPADQAGARDRLPPRGSVYVAVERGGAFDAWAERDGRLRRIFDERGVRVYERRSA